MTDLTPYVVFPGTARAALTFYAEVFGGRVSLNTLADMSRTDGPADAIAHGYLSGGPVNLFGADAVSEPPYSAEGLMFALLGTAEPAVLRQWFARLSEGGQVARRPAAATLGRPRRGRRRPVRAEVAHRLRGRGLSFDRLGGLPGPRGRTLASAVAGSTARTLH